MERTLLIVSDLVSRQQIKASLVADSVYIKDLDQLDQDLNYTGQQKIVYDLTNQKISLPNLVEKLKKHQQLENVICFYPHIHADLAEQAKTLGLQNIYPRSKFFNNLGPLLNAE